MALDEPKDTDEIFDVSGFTFVIDKDLLAASLPITVELTPIGFYIAGRLLPRTDPSCCSA